MIAGVGAAWSADPSAPDMISPFLQYGLAGMFLALFIVGWVVPRGTYQSMRDERDQWRKAFETEQAAHQLTRAALAESGKRSDAAVEAAKVAASTLRALHHLPATEGAP